MGENAVVNTNMR